MIWKYTMIQNNTWILNKWPQIIVRSNSILTLLKDTVIQMAVREESWKFLIKSRRKFKTTDCLSQLGNQHSSNNLLQNNNIVIPCSTILKSIVVLLMYR